MLPTIELPTLEQVHPRASWGRSFYWLLTHADKEDLATVKVVDDIPQMPGGKDNQLGRVNQCYNVRVNGWLVFIDPWDFSDPTGAWLAGKGPDLPIKLILKLQHNGREYPSVRGPVTVLPWTCFTRDSINWYPRHPEYRKQYLHSKHPVRIGYSGRWFNSRRPWLEAMQQIEGAYCHTYKGPQPLDQAGEPDPADAYFERICSWRFLLGIRGKITSDWTVGHNRREGECWGIGLPLILTYRPNYLNPVNDGEHYLYVETPADLIELGARLESIDTTALARRAFDWWMKNVSVRGVCQTFLQACKRGGLL